MNQLLDDIGMNVKNVEDTDVFNDTNNYIDISSIHSNEESVNSHINSISENTQKNKNKKIKKKRQTQPAKRKIVPPKQTKKGKTICSKLRDLRK